MHRSVVAVALTALAVLFGTTSWAPVVAVPSLAPLATLEHPGGDDGNLYIAPDEYFEGQDVKLTANFPNEAAYSDVTFYMETSPGSGDYEDFESDEANKYGNAVVSAYEVTEKADIFALAPNGMVTEIQTLDPKVVEPGSCTESGSTYASPSFITAGQEVKLTANFPSDQAKATVTFFIKDGDTATSIGSSTANRYGNAYLKDYAVEETQEVYGQSSKGVCSPVITLTVSTIDPDSFTETGTIKTNPGSVRDGRTATIVANFPSGSFDVTAFELKKGTVAGHRLR